MGALVQSRFDAEYLSDEFKARLDELPVSWTEANLARFADFFDTFGAYFVSRVTLGNTLEYYVSLEQTSNLLEKEFKAKVEMEYDGLFVSGSASAEMRDKQKWSSYQENRRTSAVVKGGDRTKAGRVGERADTFRCDPLSPRRTGQAGFPASGSPENVLPQACAGSCSAASPYKLTSPKRWICS
jgi:hypothetical protein